MKIVLSISVVLIALLLSSSVPYAFAAQPPVDTSTVYIGTVAIKDLRVDPKRAYDTASGGAIMNTYDTLIMTAKEYPYSKEFMPNLATEWGKDITTTPGEPIYWFKLRFTNSTGDPILFQPWEDRNGVMHTADALTMDDVVWSFYYGLVQDLTGSPMWMFWRPLFKSMNMAKPTAGLNPASAHSFVTELTTNRIWHNGTHIFFKLAFQFRDTDWLEMMTQTFSSVVSKDWAVDRGVWDGTWFKNEVGETVGTGDGVTTRFTLPQQDMPLGGADAYKKVVPGSETILLNGVPTTAYSMIYNNGTIDFDTAPMAGVVITASYEHAYFYYFHRWPETSYGPLDSKLPDYPQVTWDSYRMCGTGPYIFTGIDMVLEYFRHDRFDNYWGGWALNPVHPAHVDTVITSWADGTEAAWISRKTKFLAGDYDTIDVPRHHMFELFKPGWDKKNPATWIPVDGVYCVKNLAPIISSAAVHMTFDINPATTYAGTQQFPDGIPLDFFSNVHVRRAFAYMFNYTHFIQGAYYGEAEQPTTWSIKGLNPDYTDPTLTKWSQDLNEAKNELQLAMFTQGAETKSAWDWGFHWTLTYILSDTDGEAMCLILREALIELNAMYGVAGHFSADIAEVEWTTYLDYFHERMMPVWTFGWRMMPIDTLGWTQGYTHPDSFARAYMHSEGAFAYFQGYSNSTVDELLDPEVVAPDEEWRFKELQRIYMRDVPSFVVAQPLGRYWCRTWLKGWYYNALRPGFWHYHYWKQDGCIDTVQDMVCTVCDLNWDNIVDMKDIGIVVKAFGSTPGTPKWNYYADVAQSQGDRKIDMKDVGYVASKFGWAC